MGELFVDSRFFLENWIEGGYGSEWVNCVLTADSVRELERGCEWKGVGELCVDSGLCEGNWIDGGNGRGWGNCVLTADCVRGIG